MSSSVVSGALGLGVALAIIMLIRRDRLHVNHGLWWIAVAAGFALLGFLPGAVDAIAARLGIAYPPTLALAAAIAILVLRLLIMDIERSRLELRYQRLVQRVAMLEAEIVRVSGHAAQNCDKVGETGAKTLDSP